MEALVRWSSARSLSFSKLKSLTRQGSGRWHMPRDANGNRGSGTVQLLLCYWDDLPELAKESHLKPGVSVEKEYLAQSPVVPSNMAQGHATDPGQLERIAEGLQWQTNFCREEAINLGVFRLPNVTLYRGSFRMRQFAPHSNWRGNP